MRFERGTTEWIGSLLSSIKSLETTQYYLSHFRWCFLAFELANPRKAEGVNVIEIVIVLKAVKAKDLCMYRFYNWQEKAQVCTQEGDKMCCEAAPGYMSLLGHRDIWLQIYCRGLDGVLILLLRFYPRSPQALLSPTFTMQRFNSLGLLLYVSQ